MATPVLQRGDYFGPTLKQRQTPCVLLTLTVYEPYLKVRMHTHEHPGVFFLISGQHEETKCQDIQIQKPTTAIFHEALEPHATATGPEGMVGLNISFNKSWMASMDIASKSLETASVAINNKTRFEALRLLAMGFKNSMTDEEIETVAIDLLGTLTKNGHEKAPTWLRRFVEALDAQYCERVCLHSLAIEVGVHPNYLSRAFRNHHGCTVYDYIHRARLLRALEIIKQGGSIGMAAIESGFTDQAHLSRVCRQQLQSTPGQLRSFLA